jgi:HD-GYP domain-containing protein (c-di-GMP phosphodiesterase class II)
MKKQKIRIEDLSAHDYAPCNIFDKKGTILCKKGDIINAKLLSSLSLKELYRVDSEPEKQTSSIVSRISQETSDFVISVTKTFLEESEKGSTPSISGFMEARDKIYSEVLDNIKDISHISELRIYYNDYSLTHGVNVCSLSTALGIKLGYEPEELKLLALGALLHDIGKSKIPKQILNKPGLLSSKEFEVVKLHAPLGHKIIRDEYSMAPAVSCAVLDHHEKSDGTGYPGSISGMSINKFSQIITIADTYDAASSNKVYAEAKSSKEIIKELLRDSKTYNPRVLFTLIHMVNYNTGNIKMIEGVL